MNEYAIETDLKKPLKFSSNESISNYFLDHWLSYITKTNQYGSKQPVRVTYIATIKAKNFTPVEKNTVLFSLVFSSIFSFIEYIFNSRER